MLSRSFLLFLTLSIAGIPLATSAQQAEGIVAGTLSVKFTDTAADALDISNEGALVTTGLASIDRLNAQFGVTEMTRIFRPAGRFEGRHRAFGLHRWYTLTIPQDVAVQEAVNAYQADPTVEIAELVHEKSLNDGYEPGAVRRVDVPNGPHTIDNVLQPALPRRSDLSRRSGTKPEAKPGGIPNDPLYDDQWHYHNTGQTPPGGTPDADIDLPEAHDVQTGHPSVVVSIHDQGVDFAHEDLAGNMWVNEEEIPGNGIDDDDNGFVDDVYGYNFAQNQGAIAPGDHGTHVAGTVAAVTNNGIGVAGVAGGDGTPDSGVRLISAQVFVGTSGGGGFAESYVYAADMGAVISQNSWGYNQAGSYEQAVLDAIDYYIATAGSGPDAPMEGGLVIFAAGNSNSSANYYPGYYEPTVAVASSGIDDQKSSFSNYGEWVNITAPGGSGAPYDENDVLSTLAGNGYGYFAGTSMACPHASGVAALIVSQNLDTTNAQVRSILELTTDDIDPINPGYEGLLGTGRINAATAVGAEPDTTSPGVITDLTGIPDGEFVTLTWTAPGDDIGVANYHLRYAVSPIEDEMDWEAAIAVSGAAAMTPQEPGETEEFLATDLTFGTTYYFAVRSDDGINLSDLSNNAEIETLAPPVADVPTDPIEVTLPPDGADSYEFPISNFGPSMLSFSINLTETTESFLRGEPVPRPEQPVDWEPPVRGDEEAPEPTGEPQFMGEGGPDAFGYRWIDSNESGGPTYDWIDISETGTELTLGVDDYAIVDLPFDFPYYGNTYDWVAIQSKGALVFENDFVGYANESIPTTDLPNAIVSGYWDDLNPHPTFGDGAVYYDEDDEGRFIVSWVGVPHHPNRGSYTFQIILEPDGAIVTQYQGIASDPADENSATIGIESPDGADGLQVVYNAEYVEEELAIRFSALSVTSEPSAGAIAAGEEETITLTFDAVGLEPGTYTAAMTVTTNEAGDSLTQEYIIPITLTIGAIGTDDDDLAFEGTHRLSAVAPNPISGLAQTTLEVAEAQDVRVELFDVRGRKVATPFEGALAARSAEEIMLDGSTLSPGVYVLRISGETFSETRRVTIVR